MIKNKGAINCSDANLNSHKDEIQARVTAGTISMTGGLLPTTSHFFLTEYNEEYSSFNYSKTSRNW